MKKNIDDLDFRQNVGIMLFNEIGQVWVGRKHVEENGEMTGSTKLWQMPQGGIDPGEDPLHAAVRELREETGITSIRFLGEIDKWLSYKLPSELVGVALKGLYRGQTQRWFAFRFIGEEREVQIDNSFNGQCREFEAWEWVSIDEVLERVVSFKKDVYGEVVENFRKYAKI